jgi:HK97 family phage major capsid protein
MDDFEKKLKELTETVANLRETLEARDSSARETEADDLVKKVIDKMTPKKREMQWAIPDEKGKVPENGIYLTQFMKAITPGAEHKVSDEIRAHIKTTMIEGTDSLGGYLVPIEFSNEIIRLENEEAIIRGLARIFPMSTEVRNLPKQLTDVTVTWTAEGVAKTETNPTFAQLTQTAKKLAAIVKMTDELLEDESVGVDQFVQALVAEAMAREEDRIAFVGDVSGNSDPFNGVYFASGVTSVTMDGAANLIFDDVIDLIMAINAKYRTGATLVTSTDGLKLIMKLQDANNNYLWAPPTQVTPANIWGYPYKISDQIGSTIDTDHTAILFGNWKKNYFVSDRGGLEVKSSISASDPSNTQSAFLEDETWFRFKKRMSLDVANAAAFSKIKVR